ncbi:EAL domain-containing protein [Halomonas sp. LR3S48]|uniref:EAL domain-containing protein n=1 Tax=Halomonas sp. LR3S48 TaxID=2982694 RepID=UPI0021E4E847|nr:EAL domain-containing protein [Halomonas sp. LR3S48]UYG02048.1 EAL domain-containing protein [Halomonas sp. LR3S48]
MHRCAEKEGHCERCEGPLPFAFTMAFQPIVDLASARITAYEALVRGPGGESAGSILAQVTPRLLYRFDQACRIRAIELASRLGMRESLSINFLPNAVYEPMACIQATLAISEQVGWPVERLIFEVTETERVQGQHLGNIIEAYRSMGFVTALDDFGNGFANLDLLVELHPDRLKIDRALVMGCDSDSRRQAILRALIGLGRELGIDLVAEGVETRAEALWLARSGITQQQGFFYARPGLEKLTPGLEPALMALQRAI